MNLSLLAYGIMALGSAAIVLTSLSNFGAAGALFLFLNPLVNIEVALGDTGRSISYDKLAIMALASGFAWRVFRKQSDGHLKNKPFIRYLWLLYITWSFVAAWLSGAPAKQQFWGLAETIAYFITFLVFLDICAEETSRKRIFKALLYGGVIMLAAVAFQNLAYQITLSIWDWRHSFRADLLYSSFPRMFFGFRPGPIGHPNFLAAYLVLWATIYPLLLRMSSRLAGFFIFTAHLVILVSAGSYGGILGFAICCLAVLYVAKPHPTTMICAPTPHSKTRLLPHVLAACFTLVIGTAIANDGDFMPLSFLPRIYIHRVGGKMLSERPLAGYGNSLFPQTFQEKERAYAEKDGLKIPRWRMKTSHAPRTNHSSGKAYENLPPLSAHSSYLKAFVESGLPGGLLFLGLLMGGLLEAYFRLRKTGRLSIRSPETWGWAACIGVCFQAGTENIFSSPKISVLYWAITAYCLTAQSTKTKSL